MHPHPRFVEWARSRLIRGAGHLSTTGSANRVTGAPDRGNLPLVATARPHRLFVPQEALDAWLTDGRAQLEGDTMTTPSDGRRYRLKTALRFLTELTGTGDPNDLVGRVKDIDQINALGAEHVRDSVILGDQAYQVAEGFAAEPDVASTGTVVALLPDVPVAEPAPEDIELLAKFLLDSEK